ncbi:dimeric dihydrodiol dehydrogenase [Geopyxis carbonaria]|nr:dimeric dihydrodiol dehydrogenase [Geopyxis carbonaria]
MTEPYVCRWGILATGWIASEFTRDLLLDPKTRGCTDIVHTVTAVASSTSKAKAAAFITAVGAPASATAYDSYADLVADPSCDIIYIATPHSHHFANCLAALNAGKHVVCEKPFTVNAAQFEIVAALAKSKGLFLMEAVWTRFFPLSVAVREMVKSGRVGEVRKVTAELNLAEDPDVKYADGQHRMVNPALAGGALLDIGLYPLTWVFQTLYHTLPASEKATSAPSVTGTISRFPGTGVDAENVVVLKFPHAIGVASSGIRVATDPDERGRTAIRIQGTRGEIRVHHPAYRPLKVTVIPAGKGAEKEVMDFPIPGGGRGMNWQADEAARAVRDGRTECETMPLEESLLVLKAMDTVRALDGFRYPEEIESTDVPYEG